MKNLTIGEIDQAYSSYHLIKIDGSKCSSFKEFYEQMAIALDFPDYFGFNLDSLDELMADLSWLEFDKIIISIFSTENFLIKEKNKEKISTLLDLLDADAEELRWVDEDQKIIHYIFEPSERINNLLN